MTPRLPRMLRKKRNDLAYERGQLVARLETVTSELASIDYTLKLLDPHWKPSKKATRPPRPPRFPHGSVARACLKILPQHPGIDTTTLSALVAAKCGLQFNTDEDRFGFASAVAMALRRHQRRGLAAVIGKDPNRRDLLAGSLD